MFVGNLTQREWDRAGHFCRECEEAYAAPMLMHRTTVRKEYRVHT